MNIYDLRIKISKNNAKQLIKELKTEPEYLSKQLIEFLQTIKKNSDIQIINIPISILGDVKWLAYCRRNDTTNNILTTFLKVLNKLFMKLTKYYIMISKFLPKTMTTIDKLFKKNSYYSMENNCYTYYFCDIKSLEQIQHDCLQMIIDNPTISSKVQVLRKNACLIQRRLEKDLK